jgi:hypothetical protein
LFSSGNFGKVAFHLLGQLFAFKMTQTIILINSKSNKLMETRLTALYLVKHLRNLCVNVPTIRWLRSFSSLKAFQLSLMQLSVNERFRTFTILLRKMKNLISFTMKPTL